MDCHWAIIFIIIPVWTQVVQIAKSREAIYVGCYRQSRPPPLRDMRGLERDTMTHSLCFESCRSSSAPYAGLRRSNGCSCGHNYDRGEPLDESSCDSPCSGNSDQMCGGERTYSVHLLVYQEIRCEDEALELDCGDHFISIQTSSYGADPADNDNNDCSTETDDICSAESSLFTVRATCEGEHSCTVLSSNGVFGDPCGGIEKYLKVTYTCPKYNGSSPSADSTVTAEPLQPTTGSHSDVRVARSSSVPGTTDTAHGGPADVKFSRSIIEPRTTDVTTARSGHVTGFRGIIEPRTTDATTYRHGDATGFRSIIEPRTTDATTYRHSDTTGFRSIFEPRTTDATTVLAHPGVSLACSSPTQVGESMACTLRMEHQESWIQVDVDFGDYSSGPPSIHMRPGRVKKLHHVYEETGRYNVSAGVAGIVRAVEMVTVVDAPCALSSVSIKGISDDQTQPTDFPKASKLRISSSVELACSIEVEMLFSWQVFSEEAQVEAPYPLLPSIATNSSQLVIPPRSLDASHYRLVLQATLLNTEGDILGLRSYDGWILITQSDLIAHIVGGSQRTVGLGSAVILDGSASHDPDIEDDRSASDDQMVFSWSCLPADESLEPVGSNITCDGLTLGEDSTFRIHPGAVTTPQTLDFYLTVEKDGRTVTTSQQVVFVAGNPPQITIRCLQNCDVYIQPTSNLVLQAICGDCSSTPSYTWRFLRQTGRQGKVIERFNWGAHSLTGGKQDYLVLKSQAVEALAPGIYYLQVVVKHEGSTGRSEYSFGINTPPENGTCLIAPTNGTVLETRFIMTCEGFMDVDQPLTYTVYRTQPGIGDFLLSSYPGPVSPTLFPPIGNESDGYNVHLKVKVSDTYGGSTSSPLTIQVFPVYFGNSGALVETLLNMSSGSTSLLGNLITSGNKEAANQVVVSMATLLNEAQGNETGSLDRDTREKIRDTLIDSLSSLDLQTAEDIEQSSASIGLITEASQELSQETQVKAVGLISSMTSFMKEELATKSSFSSEQVERSSNQLATGLSNILGAAMIVVTVNESAAPSAADSEQQRAVILSVINTINVVQDVLAVNKIPGESETVVQTPAFGLSVSRQSSNHLAHMQMSSPKGHGWFQLPEGDLYSNMTDEQSEAAIDIQVVEMLDNPFSWGSNATHVTSGVMGLKLKKDDTEIQVSGLEEDYISLMLQQSSSEGNDLEVSQVTAGSLVALSIRSTESSSPSDPVQITLIPSIPSTTVYVCVLANYSTNIFSDVDGLCLQNFTLPRPSDVDTASLESTYTWTGVVPQEDRRINLHVRAGDIPEPREWSNSALNLSVYTSSPACLFWNETGETWSNRGCHLGPLSDPWFTHCLCDHLSYFGSSFLVRPNKIDLIGDAKLFLTFTDNPLVVCTVAVVFGIYLIVALWAWREDKRDLLKARMTVLEDNDPYDHYRYLITVVTGFRRGASTTANVTLTIHGSKGDSDAHILESPDHPVLLAGAHDTFLLTTRESLGEVTSIRLWHDNAGSSPEWFVSRLQVHDLQTDVSSPFLCDSWLASTIDDGKVDRTFTMATKEKLTNVKNLFTSKTSEDFQDGHLWFSVLTRPPRSSFTRFQRVSCCFSLLMTAMMTNIMFYGIPTEPGDQVLDFGAMRITIKEIIIGIEGAIIAFPINLLIVSIFRYARAPQSRSEMYKFYKPTAEESAKSSKTPTSGLSVFGGNSINLTSTVKGKPPAMLNGNMNKEQGVVLEDAQVVMPAGFESINGVCSMVASVKDSLQESHEDVSSLTLPTYKGEFQNASPRVEHCKMSRSETQEHESVGSERGTDILRDPLSSPFGSLPQRLVQGVIDSALSSRRTSSQSDPAMHKTETETSVDQCYSGSDPVWSYNQLLYTKLIDLVMELEGMDPVCFSSEEEYQKALYGARALVLTATSVATPSSSSYDTSINSLEGRLFSSSEDSNWWLKKRPQESKKDKRRRGLPHCFVYIGWLLLIATCLGSAYVTMLYGLKYGLQRSLDWLVSLIVSTVQSIFITQPIKIVLLAIFLSMIFRQWEDEDDGAEDIEADIEEREIDNAEVIHAKLLQEKQADVRYRPPPTESTEKHRLLKEKEHQLYDLLQEIVGYLFFIWLLCIITYSRRDRYAYYLTKNIKDRYFEGNKIYRVNLTHFKGFFEWTESAVVPSLYGTDDYEADTQSLLLGGVRIRQLRVRPDSCTLVKTMEEAETDIPECWSPYSRLSEDRRSYNGSWQYPTALSGDDYDPWSYQDSLSLPYAGWFTTYHRGGYVWYLGNALSETERNVAEMKARRWLDEYTRAIFVDWAVYNGNINMFGIVTCLLETPAGGGMLKTLTVNSVRLYRSSSNTGVFVTLCEVGFSVYLLYYMYREITHVREQKAQYWTSVWNWLEVIIIISALVMIALYIAQLVFVKRLFEEYRGQPGRFFDFREGAMMENNLTYSSAFLVILSTVKFLHLLRLNPRMYLLTSVMFHSASEVLGFMFLIFLLICAFSLFLTPSIGTSVGDFRSFLASFVTLFNTIPGNFDADEMRRAARYFGTLTVVAFQCLTYFLCLNLLISALNDNMIHVRRHPKISKDGIMGLLLLSKILSFFGIRKRVKIDV